MSAIIATPEPVQQPDASPEDRLIVLYDCLCGLCDGVVQFLLRRDAEDIFRFAPQQSDFAKRILSRHGLDVNSTQTIYLIGNYGLASELVFTKSDVTLRIANELGGIWNAAQFARLLPHSVRDAAYDFVARNRFRIFGKRTECRLVGAAEQHKFLS